MQPDFMFSPLNMLFFDCTVFSRILKQLRQSCQTDAGEDDLKKGIFIRIRKDPKLFVGSRTGGFRSGSFSRSSGLEP
jgi:hypothetical protein